MAIFRKSTLLFGKGTRMTAVALLSSALLLHVARFQPTEANFTAEIMGGAKDYSATSKMVAEIISGVRSELYLPVPEEIASQDTGVAEGPTPWPSVFHAKSEVSTPDGKLVAHSFYEFKKNRMMNILIPALPQTVISLLSTGVKVEPEYYSESMKRTVRAFEESGDANGVVDQLDGQLFFPDTALWMRLKPYHVDTYSKTVPFCTMHDLPRSPIPPPNIMEDAKFVGQEEVDGIKCNVYAKGRAPRPYDDKAFIKYYEDVEKKIPVKLVLFDTSTVVIKQFEPDATLAEGEWALPEYCGQEAKPGFPVSIME